MQIECIKVGFLETNCYILTKNNKCLIIDPGDEASKIKEKINGEIIGILLTHRHFDHVGAINDLINDRNVTIYDKSNLIEGLNKIGIFDFEVIYNPGHTTDSISFLFDNIMFTGDFIFKNSIGRTDIGGNNLDMINSLTMIKKYNDNIVIYPGHGDSSILGLEKINFGRYYDEFK